MPPPRAAQALRSAADPLAHAKLANNVRDRLALPGIVLEGQPHEVLGIGPQASREVIQKAWKDLMKRYHPDKVGRPGSPEWKDAQKIAEVLNRAKDEMLARKGRASSY